MLRLHGEQSWQNGPEWERPLITDSSFSPAQFVYLQATTEGTSIVLSRASTELVQAHAPSREHDATNAATAEHQRLC